MKTTELLQSSNFSPAKHLPEVPRFFERSLPAKTASQETNEELEPGEAQFRQDFQPRWWPGDMNVYTPAPKG